MIKRIEFEKTEEPVQPLFFEFESKDGILTDGQYGIGSVKYCEGSVYYGTLIYRNGEFNKFGYGEQNFLNSTISAEGMGAPFGLVLYKYVGQYDYRVNDWIFGNGIVYFLDKEGRPAAYIKGSFSGLNKVGPWKGKFTKDLLLDGFENAREVKLVPFRYRYAVLLNKVKKVRVCDNVFIGDSWVEMYEAANTEEYSGTFKEDTAGKDVINLGIGGTKFLDWESKIIPLLKNMRFKRVFINLGFNDVHCGFSSVKIFENFKNVTGKIKTLNPDAEIYINAVCPSPAQAASLQKEREISAILKDYCDNNEGFTFIECDKAFMNGEEPIENLAEYFIPDRIHLNKRGYKVWAPYFLKYVR